LRTLPLVRLRLCPNKLFWRCRGTAEQKGHLAVAF
jgi:hypothetical protein